jgi:hypothetical protein
MDSSAIVGKARPYDGPDRRRNQVFVTRNTEYHCHAGSCVAVRDRRTGEFERDHPAIGRHITAGIRFARKGGLEQVSPPASVHAGEQLCFSSGRGDLENDLITSTLVTIERPPKDVTRQYASS